MACIAVISAQSGEIQRHTILFIKLNSYFLSGFYSLENILRQSPVVLFPTWTYTTFYDSFYFKLPNSVFDKLIWLERFTTTTAVTGLIHIYTFFLVGIFTFHVTSWLGFHWQTLSLRDEEEY